MNNSPTREEILEAVGRDGVVDEPYDPNKTVTIGGFGPTPVEIPRSSIPRTGPVRYGSSKKVRIPAQKHRPLNDEPVRYQPSVIETVSEILDSLFD